MSGIVKVKNPPLREPGSEAAINLFYDFVWKKVIRTEPCSYCGKRDYRPNQRGYIHAPTVDHVDPTRKGVDEIVPACGWCNGAKGRGDLLMFLLRLSVAREARRLHPRGRYRRSTIRRLAREIGLPRAEIHEWVWSWRRRTRL